jgi:PDZ domain-containing protein
MGGYKAVEQEHDASSLEGRQRFGAAVSDTGSYRSHGRGRSGAHFHWGLWHSVVAVLAVILVAAVIAWFIPLPYYALTPGSAPAVSSLIKVPSAHRHSHRGSVLLVYVELTSMRALYYPFFWLDHQATIYPSAAILGSESAAQYAVEAEIDMETAQQAATVVALTRLGYKVHVEAVGALVYGILPASPASGAIGVGDVISEINGSAIHTYLDLESKLEDSAPGATIHLVVSSYPNGVKHKATMRLGAFRIQGRGSAATLDCFAQGKGTKYKIFQEVTVKGGKAHPIACMGIYAQGEGGSAVDGTAFEVGRLPIKIDLASEGIVGPSAGLAFTLGLMEELDRADLTGGRKVAATGTMSIDGTVGDVGGVVQKTIAVRNAGARVFFVPPGEYAAAKAHAGSSLKVYAVSTIGRALSILESLGGRISGTTAK